jgi:hypothetical protein
LLDDLSEEDRRRKFKPLNAAHACACDTCRSWSTAAGQRRELEAAFARLCATARASPKHALTGRDTGRSGPWSWTLTLDENHVLTVREAAFASSLCRARSGGATNALRELLAAAEAEENNRHSSSLAAVAAVRFGPGGLVSLRQLLKV